MFSSQLITVGLQSHAVMEGSDCTVKFYARRGLIWPLLRN